MIQKKVRKTAETAVKILNLCCQGDTDQEKKEDRNEDSFHFTIQYTTEGFFFPGDNCGILNCGIFFHRQALRLLFLSRDSHSADT
jgi:hypothetical protein